MRNNKKNLRTSIILLIICILIIIFNIYAFIIGPHLQEEKIINKYKESLIFQHNKPIEYYSTYSLDNIIYTYYDDNNYYLINKDLNKQNVIKKDTINLNKFIEENNIKEYDIKFGYTNDIYVIALVTKDIEYIFNLDTKEYLYEYKRNEI